MTSHDEAHDESRALCDLLAKGLVDPTSSVTCRAARGCCVVGTPAFAQIYHRKTSPKVEIWIRGEPRGGARGFDLRERNERKSNYAARWPVRFDLRHRADVPRAIQLLQEVAGEFGATLTEPSGATVSPSKPRRAFLLTWTDASWAWEDFPNALARVRKGEPERIYWRCKDGSVRPGDLVFLLRQRERGGIVGSGVALAKPDNSTDRQRVMVEFDRLLPVADRLDQSALSAGALSAGAPGWSTRFSGRALPPRVADALEDAWNAHVARITGVKAGDTNAVARAVVDDDIASAFEGEQKLRFVIHRKREHALRARKLREARQKHDGRLLCEVPRCGFDFERVYGPIAADYAQVHHLDPLASDEAVRETRIDRLAVVCANCHVMIHLGGTCRELADLIPPRSAPGHRPADS